DFEINCRAEPVGRWIGQGIDQFDARVLVTGFLFSVVRAVGPVGDVNGRLKTVGDAEFEFVAKIEAIDSTFGVAGLLPSDPIFDLDSSLGGGCGLVAENEFSLARRGR